MHRHKTASYIPISIGWCKSISNSIYGPNKVLAPLVWDENSIFYADLKIGILKGECVMQIGTYQYKAKKGVKQFPL